MIKVEHCTEGKKKVTAKQEGTSQVSVCVNATFTLFIVDHNMFGHGNDLEM